MSLIPRLLHVMLAGALVGCADDFDRSGTSPTGGQRRNEPRELSDAKRLDQLERVFPSAPQFGDRFWRESKRLADERGPEILRAVMIRARIWRGEEGLVFLPLLALLPRDRTLELLEQYEHSGRKSDRVYAREFRIELEANDTQKMVRTYSSLK